MDAMGVDARDGLEEVGEVRGSDLEVRKGVMAFRKEESTGGVGREG